MGGRQGVGREEERERMEERKREIVRETVGRKGMFSFDKCNFQ